MMAKLNQDHYKAKTAQAGGKPAGGTEQMAHIKLGNGEAVDVSLQVLTGNAHHQLGARAPPNQTMHACEW